jgi:hypothetical protein
MEIAASKAQTRWLRPGIAAVISVLFPHKIGSESTVHSAPEEGNGASI